jgi:hypothetical protein
MLRESWCLSRQLAGTRNDVTTSRLHEQLPVLQAHFIQTVSIFFFLLLLVMCVNRGYKRKC